MRVSETLIPTLREDPGEAETVSHRLMLRAGLIRKVAAGIYTYLPLGLRVLRKIERIVREEMNRAGAQELLMPVASPADTRGSDHRSLPPGSSLIPADAVEFLSDPDEIP